MRLRHALLAAAALAATTLAHADTISSVVVYGDSLSDNGNAYAASHGTIPPSPPYFQGRFSNGPVAVEQLATRLHASLTDFAFAGATTGIGNEFDHGTQTSTGYLGLPGMLTELASPASQALLASPLASSSLFVVWGGANDLLVSGSPTVAAQNIDRIVSTLEAAGARHILVPGIPDLGLTPDFLNTPASTAATAYSEAFNADLLATLPAGATYVDTFNLLHQVDSDPSAFGFTNTTQPCLNTSTGVVCSNPDQYLFFDGFHPTSAADAIVANQFYEAATPTPEPSAFILLGTGLTGIVGLARRTRSRLGAR